MGGYIQISREDVLVFMGLNCENCHNSRDCYYCKVLWNASIDHVISVVDAQHIGLTPTHSICKLKK